MEIQQNHLENFHKIPVSAPKDAKPPSKALLSDYAMSWDCTDPRVEQAGHVTKKCGLWGFLKVTFSEVSCGWNGDNNTHLSSILGGWSKIKLCTHVSCSKAAPLQILPQWTSENTKPTQLGSSRVGQWWGCSALEANSSTPWGLLWVQEQSPRKVMCID